MEERFIYLLKQQLIKQISKTENEELQELLSTNDELQKIYQAIYSPIDANDEANLLESEQSYAAHVVRMHLNGALK
jgi:hypothetical protein